MTNNEKVNQQFKMKTKVSLGKINIRRYKSSDVSLLYEAVRESIPDISRWLPWCQPGYSIDESRTWVNSRDKAWKKEEDYSFVIYDTQTNQFLGGVGINQINQNHAFGNLGYWVRTSWCGKGIATAATIQMARFGFKELKLKRIEILADVQNIASQRVAEKAGAKREGILRKRLSHKDQAFDAVLFSFVEEDLNIYH